MRLVWHGHSYDVVRAARDWRAEVREVWPVRKFQTYFGDVMTAPPSAVVKYLHDKGMLNLDDELERVVIISGDGFGKSKQASTVQVCIRLPIERAQSGRDPVRRIVPRMSVAHVVRAERTGGANSARQKTLQK